MDFLPHTYYDPVTNIAMLQILQCFVLNLSNANSIIITMLSYKFDNAHPLVALIKNCLHNEPERQPTARQALEKQDILRAALVYDPYRGLNRVEL